MPVSAHTSLEPKFRSGYFLCIAGLALGYFLAGRIGLELAVFGSLVTLVWLPSGMAVVALFRWGRHYWPGVWLGAFAVNATASNDLILILAVSSGNTVASLVAAALLRRWRFNPDIGSVRDVVIFVGAAALLSMTLSATCGALSLLLTQAIAPGDVGMAWFTWWLGDAVGVVLGGFALVTYRHGTYRRLWRGEHRTALIAALLWLLLVSVAWSFVVPDDPVGQMLSLTFPVGVLVWIAFRLGSSPAAVAVLIVSVVGSGLLVNQSGPFADAELYLSITKFWAYINTVAVVALLVSALNAERARTINDLARSEARFRSLTQLSSDWYWEQDADFRFVRVEGEFVPEHMLVIAEEVGKTRWDTPALNLSAADWRAHQAALEAHLPFHDFEIERLGKDHRTHWSRISGIPIRTPDGKFLGYRGVGENITKRKLAEKKARHAAHYDALTGLPNRALFMDRLAQEVQRAKRAQLQVAVLLLDLDDFKGINDTMGHDQGDRLLVQAAQRIKACVRETDTVARLGGDEFTVILHSLQDTRQIALIAEKIIAAISLPFVLETGSGYVTATVGVALYPQDETQIEGLLKAADQAMYAAKAAGRNRFGFFTPDLQEKAQHRLWLTREMRVAVREKLFSVVYQPIINLQTGRCTKAEILLRWTHPATGSISPAEFIPVAESSGLIMPLGEWVFEQAAHEVQRCRRLFAADFQISVNKSPVQFSNLDKTVAPWGERLALMGLPGNSIVAEITEGLLLGVSPAVQSHLRSLQAAGIQLALDDFGTGFSSLAYLQKHDIDYLKIDQVFVRNLAVSSKDLALCEAMVVMAHKLGLRVIAEGVETALQRDLLTAAGCDFGQGYWFARPLGAKAFEAFVVQQNLPAAQVIA